MLNDRGFDLWADGYDKSVSLSDESDTYPFAGYKNVLNRIYGRIRAGGGRRVLDVGVGTAVLAGRLYADGYDVTGIDFSARMLQIAREKMPTAHLIRYDFALGLPNELDESQFDAIICTYAIHHLTDAQKIIFIRRLMDRLAPGGRLFIGDIAFETRAELEECRADCGDEWDDDEFYIVADELRENIPAAEFEKISYCAGILQVK